MDFKQLNYSKTPNQNEVIFFISELFCERKNILMYVPFKRSAFFFLSIVGKKEVALELVKFQTVIQLKFDIFFHYLNHFTYMCEGKNNVFWE